VGTTDIFTRPVMVHSLLGKHSASMLHDPHFPTLFRFPITMAYVLYGLLSQCSRFFCHHFPPLQPITVPSFSAVCYFTGREIYKALNRSVPIGLVEADWGGTRLEAWSPPSALAACSTDNATVCKASPGSPQEECSAL